MKTDYIKKVDHYLLTEELGRGVYGIVYKGVHETTMKEVAVKMIPKAKLEKRNLEYLERESETLQKIKNKYIIELFELLKTDNNYYMVFDYCNCKDLDHFRKEHGGRLEEKEARRFIKQIVKGLSEIHNNGIIHRDIKLPNILLKKQSNGKIIAKLGDFGFAKQIKDALNDKDVTMSEIKLANSFVGTPLNMAPEMLSKKEYNYKTDIWSLGIITYQLLVGTYPFMSAKRDELKILVDNAKYTLHSSLNLSPYAMDFINRCLKYDPLLRMGMEQVIKHDFITLEDEELTNKEIREQWLNINFPHQTDFLLDTKQTNNFLFTEPIEEISLPINEVKEIPQKIEGPSKDAEIIKEAPINEEIINPIQKEAEKGKEEIPTKKEEPVIITEGKTDIKKEEIPKESKIEEEFSSNLVDKAEIKEEEEKYNQKEQKLSKKSNKEEINKISPPLKQSPGNTNANEHNKNTQNTQEIEVLLFDKLELDDDYIK